MSKPAHIAHPGQGYRDTGHKVHVKAGYGRVYIAPWDQEVVHLVCYRCGAERTIYLAAWEHGEGSMWNPHCIVQMRLPWGNDWFGVPLP